LGTRIGAFEKLEEVGAGGAWAGLRAIGLDDAYRQQVAIKVINTRHGILDRHAAAVPHEKRKILASLGKHQETIARLLTTAFPPA